MGRGQELLDAARKGDGRTVTKILTLITKRSGPFTSLRRGAGVNVQDDNGYTPLHHACMNGHREIVHLLLSVDASPCVVDKKGATPLHLAAWKGDSTVVSMLLGHTNPPVNIDQKTNDQETALVIAAQFGFVDVVTRLIARGADVTLRNNKEESALDLAAQYGKLETVEQLISARPQLIDPYRFPISRGRSFPTTPLHRATMNGHKEVVAYLIDAGIDPNIRTDNGTALHEGVRYLSASVVRVLLSKGADLKAVDRQGHSVQSLLETYPKEATRRVKRVIKEYENQMKTAYESEDDPAQDYSPTAYVNTPGMIRVLPTLSTSNDASTNVNVNKKVTNTRFPLKNKSLSLSKPKFNRYFTTKINKSHSSYNFSTNATLPETQPSYVNKDELFVEEKYKEKDKSGHAETLYGNIERFNVGKELSKTQDTLSEPENVMLYANLESVNLAKELRERMDSISGSQNSLKKKPKPPPKPQSPAKQPSVSSLNDMLSKQLSESKSQLKVETSEVDGRLKSPIKNDDEYVMVNKTFVYEDEISDVDSELKSRMKNDDEYVTVNKILDDGNDVYENLPDDEKAKRYGDASLKNDNGYTTMTSDYIYTPMNGKSITDRRSVPNMGYVQMTGNGISEATYVTMDNETVVSKQRSLSDIRTLRGKCDGVHLKGAEGCIFSSNDYLYTYVLKAEVEKDDLSPFIKKKMRMDQMPCFCHEEKRTKNKGSEVFYSCEDIYVLINKNQIYNSLSDITFAENDKPDTKETVNQNSDVDLGYDLVGKEYVPFKKEPSPSTSSDEPLPSPSKRISKIIKKKIEQAKQLMTDWKAPETQKNTNINLSLSPSSSSLTKNHQSFVKKLASKCLGLKAKFNSAPNISNSSGLDSEVSAKLPNPDQKSSTNTLLIGNSKFFNKILSKREESGEIVCNDEFDTISLDRLGTLSRDSAVNRSNRSCPGFKTSLPNISENAELSDSESVIITEIDCDIPKQQAPKQAINLHTKFTIFEPRESTISSNNNSVISSDSADLVNECYEACAFSDKELEKSSENNNYIPKPLPRVNVAVHSSEDGVIYENVAVVSKVVPPKPAVRNNVPSKIPLDEVQRKALYENITVLRDKTKDEVIRPIILSPQENKATNIPSAPPKSRSPSISSESSDDSMEDESNLEDILLSEKSKSFKRGGKLNAYSSKSIVSKSVSNASNVSEFTEASAIENVDCSEEIYTTMTGTLPHKTKKDPNNKKKVLFRHKTFTNIEVDRNSLNLKKTPDWHNEFMKETLAHYHIRGTGHCIYKAPTVQEFIYIFNRETLYTDTPPFTKVPNEKRESYFETAICFCRPKVPKHHKSAEDLLELPADGENEENKVTIDVDALRARNEIFSTSFRCFCDSGTCTFHSKKRESPNNLIVKFSAVKRSISTPDITLDSSFSAVNRSRSMKYPSEIHYAVTNIEDIILRNKKIATENPNSPKSPVYTYMSQPSTISSSVGRYSIKDIADVISLNSHSESTDASPVCALNSVHLPLRKSTSSEYSGRWTLASCNSNATVHSDASYKTCHEDPDQDSDDGTLHSDEDSSDAETVKSDVSTAKRPWVHSDSFNFGNNGPRMESYAILEEDSNSSGDENSFDKFESSKVESGISVEGSDSSSSGCDEDSGVPGVDAVSLGVASLERDAGCGGVRSGSGRRRWEEAEGTSEGDALSVSSAASSCAPHHLAHHHDYSKVSPTPPKKPPRRNLSVSPTHANSPSSGYSYELRPHARSQDDLDEIQGAKHYLKHGRSVDQYVDGKLSYSEFEENQNSPRVAPVPNPRPSLKLRSQPVAITAMYENVVIKEQNPRRKLRRNNFGPQYENHEPRMEERVRKYSNQDRSSLESLLDDQSMNSPSDCERYYDGQRTDIPLSPTHYEQPPTPDHPPPTPRQAENSIHERIRPLSQEYKRRSMLRDSQTDTEYLLRAMSVASVASGATDRSGNTDNCVEEYVCDVPFAGLFKGSTTTLDGIGLRPMPAERPKTLRKLKSVYDASPTEQTSVNISSLSSNGQSTDRNVNGCEDEVRRRSNTTSSTHSADKSLSILSPFDEQEEWAKISEIMASFGSKLVRESVFVSELEQEFTSRLGLSCSESSLSPSVASNLGLWLSGLGLHDYEPLFLESGYDDVEFVNGILDENDLREMGIEENDRQRILESAKQLPLKITEISNNYNNNNISKNQNESVEDWLRNINLEIYNDTFRKHLYVDMDRVRRIWEVELTAVLEIQKAGHRKRILASVSGEHNGPVNHMDINTDLNSLKNNIKHLKDDIKEKLPVSENLKPVAPPVVPSLAPPGGETLKRSKKNRPAPQPPRPSDLEIRAPSELLVGVPGALKTQWKHQPFVLVTGAVTYVANYLGSTVVKELRGTESTKKSIQKLKKSTKEPRDSPDIILSISYRGVKFLNTITRELICEHEIRNIHCACQDADDLTHFAYITKDHTTKSHYCHVFRVATMDQATEVILTLGEAFEVAYQMALREQSNRVRVTQSQAKTPTHDPMTTTNKDKPNVNHGRSHSITEIKLNGHQLKIAPMPASLSNEDFQASRNSDGSRSPRTPLLKAPMASTEEL